MPSSNGSTDAPDGVPALIDRLPGTRGQPDFGNCAPRVRMCGALDRLNTLAPPWDEVALTGVLHAVAGDFGFSHAAVLSVPSTDDGGTATRLLLSNWPESFATGYEQLGLHRSKLVVGALKTDPMPFVWDIDTLYGADEPDPSPAARMLLDAHYLAGAFFPVHGLTAFNGAVSFAGRSCAISAAATRELHLFAFALFGMLAAARFEENRRNNPLSVRERDCLKLAMLGKTSSEIGIILSLSEYTISQYLTAAQRKLDASNRTHAVALAAQLGYLS
ncbi:autoinducer binding domain-containing protein [Aurantimonas sp. A2-1-M11]|uniref:helix-turn-helix transcriptional regulator n=1 Tax=Aurantimonas sp. A2-1-M11 TaxID=3113712 RepID=UPI002F94F7F6